MSKAKGKSSTQLQSVIKEKMSELGISVHALEKQAGLKRSAVQNILHGRSKNPSANILHAVAKILGCNINDLLAHPDTGQTTHTETQKTSAEPFNLTLYAEAAHIAQNTLKDHPTPLGTEESLRYIRELYQYSVDTQLPRIDKNFATWLAGKFGNSGH
jgi:transcriptional regulator with XRE-family HTH domain